MAFTDETLAALMAVRLGDVGTTLFGADPATSPAILEAVQDVAALIGHAVADETDQLKLRVIGTWLAWRTALFGDVGSVDLEAGPAKLKSSQEWDHLVALYDRLETQAASYPEVAAVISGSNVAVVSGISAAGSPYGWRCAGGW